MSDKETFKNIVDSYPFVSSYICFARLIKGKGYSRVKINRLFNELVNKLDYNQGQKSDLLDNLVEYGLKGGSKVVKVAKNRL